MDQFGLAIPSYSYEYKKPFQVQQRSLRELLNPPKDRQNVTNCLFGKKVTYSVAKHFVSSY